MYDESKDKHKQIVSKMAKLKAELDGAKRANIAVGGASYPSDSSSSSDDEFNGSIFAKHARVDLPGDGATGNGNGGKPDLYDCSPRDKYNTLIMR